MKLIMIDLDVLIDMMIEEKHKETSVDSVLFDDYNYKQHMTILQPTDAAQLVRNQQFQNECWFLCQKQEK